MRIYGFGPFPNTTVTVYVVCNNCKSVNTIVSTTLGALCDACHHRPHITRYAKRRASRTAAERRPKP